VNVYKEGRVAYSETALEIIKDVMKKVHLLLKEWPDHPTLNQVSLLVLTDVAQDSNRCCLSVSMCWRLVSKNLL